MPDGNAGDVPLTPRRGAFVVRNILEEVYFNASAHLLHMDRRPRERHHYRAFLVCAGGGTCGVRRASTIGGRTCPCCHGTDDRGSATHSTAAYAAAHDTATYAPYATRGGRRGAGCRSTASR